MASMEHFFETIRIAEGDPHNLRYHTARLNRTRREIFGCDDPIDLADHITPPGSGLYRCRITYGREIETVEYLPYSPRSVHSFRLVLSDITYPHKATDRRAIDALFARRGAADEILIVSPEGRLRDTAIANIALRRDGRWLTPANPLLPGTVRARLLDEGLLSPADLTVEDLEQTEGFAVMNAMVGFRPIDDPLFFPFSE